MFVPEWEKHAFQAGSLTSERVCLCCFEEHVLAISFADKFVDKTFYISNVFNRELIASHLVDVDRIIFISVSDYSYTQNDKLVDRFLDFLKLVQQIGRVNVDIVTVRSILCSIYGAVIHPLDAVLVGMSQTFAQEVDISVRVFVLDDLSEDRLYWVKNGVFPKKAPIVVTNSNFFIPKLLSKPFYNRSLQMFSGRAFVKYGTYLILGGNGGLGSMLARYLAQEYRSNLVLIGRSQENRGLINELRADGASSVHYERVDVSDFYQLSDCFAKYKSINGIIHSAINLKDSLISNMQTNHLLDVLSPKVQGTLNLLRVLRDRNCSHLDFILFFSSVQSYIANPGQANYTAACVAKDALASNLRELYMLNAKIINWSFWGDIGVVASEYYRKRMSRLGIESIHANEGIRIIEWFLASKLQQITVIKASNDALQRLDIGGELI